MFIHAAYLFLAAPLYQRPRTAGGKRKRLVGIRLFLNELLPGHVPKVYTHKSECTFFSSSMQNQTHLF